MTARDAHSDDMERLLRYLGATDPLELDFGTADRLLDGAVHSDDAPRAYSQVAQALATLRSLPTEAELADERQAVARIAAVIAEDTVRYNGERARAKRRGRAVRRRRRVTALALAAAVSGVWLIVGLAAAGALPKGVQTVASQVLDTIGVNVPNPGDDAPNVVVPASVDPSSTAPGIEIADATHANNGKGRGAVVSADASNGKAHANQEKVPPGLVNGTASNAGGNGNGNGNGNDANNADNGVHGVNSNSGGNGKGGGR
jgi:hypothetical protein